MPSIILNDWIDGHKQYILDTTNNDITVVREEGRNAYGFGEYRTVGLIKERKNLFIAIYVYQNNMVMKIGEHVVDWSNNCAKTTRETIFPYAKLFSVFRNEQVIIAVKYWYCDLAGTFPNDPGGDFFSYLEYTTRSALSIKRFMYCFTAISQGRNTKTQEFVDELNKYLNAL